eukprot:12949916-Ditylum_brightwellii.AAC.1
MSMDVLLFAKPGPDKMLEQNEKKEKTVTGETELTNQGHRLVENIGGKKVEEKPKGRRVAAGRY